MGTRWIVVVAVVFIASLATLVASAALALWNSTDELVARDRLRAAASALAEASRDVPDALSSDEPGNILSEPENRRLAEIARRVLVDYPQVEGGFYLMRSNQFAGALMTAREPINLPSDKDGKAAKKDIDKDKKGDKKKADKKA